MRSPYRKVVGHCLRNSFAYPWQRTPCPPWVIGPWRRSLRLFERTLADARLTLAGGRTEQAPAGPRRENALAVIDMVEALGDTAWSAPPAVIPESRLKSSDSTRLRQVLGLAAKDYRLKLEPDHSSSIPGSRRIAVEARPHTAVWARRRNQVKEFVIIFCVALVISLCLYAMRPSAPQCPPCPSCPPRQSASRQEPVESKQGTSPVPPVAPSCPCECPPSR